jgi:hypothetical protein
MLSTYQVPPDIEQIGNRCMSTQNKQPYIDLEKDVAVVQSYCKLLESRKDTVGREVLDSVKLSHPKPIIKQSLLTVLNISEDSTEIKMLSAAFVLLADFQQSDVETVGGTASATGIDIVALERASLIEELQQAGSRRVY